MKTLFAGLAVAVLAILPAWADFPEKPIEFVIPFGAGGGADIEGRLLAEEMSKVLGVKVVPVNKPGGGGAITYTYVKNAAPDGYTVAWNSTSLLTTTNIGNVDFDHTALGHLGRVEFQPMPFAVLGSAPWKTFKEFAADCKANPGKYKIANSGAGSATHLAAISVASAIGCEVIHLPVGIKRRNATVLSGEADAMLAPMTGAHNLNKAGKIRILAIPSAERNSVIPDVPTMVELGFNADLDLFRGLSVPKGTPDAVVAKLTAAMSAAANSDAFKGLAKKKGFTIAPTDAAAFGDMLMTQDAVVKDIMKGAGLYQSKKN